jgi:hypothetical protein
MQIEQLAYAPAIEPEETLWSWVTRVALYHGWSASEFLRLAGFGECPWDDHFRQLDVDCASPEELIARLAELTGFDRHVLSAHRIERSASTLWLDERVAFCERCWEDTAVNPIPVVQRAWLDAWCIDCPIHGCPLVTIETVHRPRYAADWNAAWATRIDWAQRTNAVCTPSTAALFARSDLIINRPPGAVLAERTGNRQSIVREPRGGNCIDTCAQAAAPAETYEKRLVLLAGKRWGEFSLARAFFDIHECIAWRNTEKGHDPRLPVSEPLGSLIIRSGAIRIGRALVDILFEQPYREPRIANPLRRWIGGLFGKPRKWLLSEVATWPPSVRERWKRQFEWTDEFEWRRFAPSAPATAEPQCGRSMIVPSPPSDR